MHELRIVTDILKVTDYLSQLGCIGYADSNGGWPDLSYILNSLKGGLYRGLYRGLP